MGRSCGCSPAKSKMSTWNDGRVLSLVFETGFVKLCGNKLFTKKTRFPQWDGFVKVVRLQVSHNAIHSASMCHMESGKCNIFWHLPDSIRHLPDQSGICQIPSVICQITFGNRKNECMERSRLDIWEVQWSQKLFLTRPQMSSLYLFIRFVPGFIHLRLSLTLPVVK